MSENISILAIFPSKLENFWGKFEYLIVKLIDFT